MKSATTAIVVAASLASACTRSADSDPRLALAPSIEPWTAAPPDPLVTNHGVCFSRAALRDPWTARGTRPEYGLDADPWDFGLVAPLSAWNYEALSNAIFEQSHAYLEVVDLNGAAKPLPERALELLRTPYARMFDGGSPFSESIPGFTARYRFAPGSDYVVLESDDHRIAAECSQPIEGLPNPTCRAFVLGPRTGIALLLILPYRAMREVGRIAADAEAFVRSLEVQCPADAKPTFGHLRTGTVIPSLPVH